MKFSKKAIELVKKGLTPKTVSKLTESEINVLHKKMVSEIIQTTTPSYTITQDELKKGIALPQQPAGKSMTIKQTPQGTIKATPSENEISEDETDDVTDSDSLGKDALQSYTGQDAPHDANDMAPDGMDDDSDDNRKMMGMAEEKQESNPWAICTAQLGKEFGTQERHLWSAKEKNKYERCVKDVKKSLKEGKNPVSLFLEHKIQQIVEKHIPPRITKKDLVNFLTEKKDSLKEFKYPNRKKEIDPIDPMGDPYRLDPMRKFNEPEPEKEETKKKKEEKEKKIVSPTNLKDMKGNKPAVAPTRTKPTTAPKTKPAHPGKNPHPGEKTSPKAKKETVEQKRESAPTIAPTRVKPDTAPRTRPSHPGKNPHPGEKPSPKAKVNYDNAKDEVIKAIVNLLKK